MRVELAVMLRGEARRLVWDEGVLTGDSDVLRRLRLRDPDDRLEHDLVATIRGIEAATAQRVVFCSIEDEPQRPVARA